MASGLEERGAGRSVTAIGSGAVDDAPTDDALVFGPEGPAHRRSAPTTNNPARPARMPIFQTTPGHLDLRRAPPDPAESGAPPTRSTPSSDGAPGASIDFVVALAGEVTG